MTTNDERVVRKIVQKHVHRVIVEYGMMMDERIDRVDIYAIADEVIAWADRREKRHERAGI